MTSQEAGTAPDLVHRYSSGRCWAPTLSKTLKNIFWENLCVLLRLFVKHLQVSGNGGCSRKVGKYG